MISRYQQKLTTVLVVDEAHHLEVEVLEEIRLLTNLETAEAKLLQILLVGQPGLDLKMDSFELRQLKQRIALRSQLEPLTWKKPKAISSAVYSWPRPRATPTCFRRKPSAVFTGIRAESRV